MFIELFLHSYFTLFPGICNIEPKLGIAVKSLFHINCTGWKDTETPLLYEVAHVTDILTTVVCRQGDEICKTLLPVGEGVNSILRIRVRIYDALHMFTEEFHTIRVSTVIYILYLVAFAHKIHHKRDAFRATTRLMIWSQLLQQ